MEASKSNNILALKPILPDQTVFTHSWVDNFDIKVDRIGGGGSINATHLMAFQEHPSHCQSSINTITVPRKKSQVLFYEDISVEVKPVNVYKKPEKIQSRNVTCNAKKRIISRICMQCGFAFESRTVSTRYIQFLKDDF